MDKGERIKEIVDKMQKRTPQKSKNPSLVQKEIKKVLKKDDVVEKKEEKKEEKKDAKKARVTELVKKVKASLNKKSSEGHGKDFDEKELKDTVDFLDDLLSGEEDFDYSSEDKGSLQDAQKVLKSILQNS